MQDLTLEALLQQLCNKHLIGNIAVLWIYCTLGAILYGQTMQSFIETARNNFNQTSRLVKFFRNIRLQGQAPKWLQPHHELTQIFKEQKDLLEHGTVVWGCIVLYVVIGYIAAKLAYNLTNLDDAGSSVVGTFWPISVPAGIIIMILDWLWKVPITNIIEAVSDFFDKDDTPEERF